MSGATAFVVNDAATAANADDVVAVTLGVPTGFNVPAHDLLASAGMSVSVIAAGLQNPRFMAFDSGGNLLVADAAAGAVYRYRAGSATITPTPTAPAPLDGIRVVDISRLVAGNMVSLQMADQGAEVIKIEDPKVGDPLRAWRVKGLSLHWKVYARNKKSLTLDLRKAHSA